MEPMQLAVLVHELFCEFDKSLAKTSLFKVDNMGDAYLCCAALPTDTRDISKMAERQTINEALFMAHSILQTMQQIRAGEVGGGGMSDLHVRVGLATGSVVTGVMGRSQSRFHILGPAIVAANELEQGAPIDHVNVDPLIMSCLVPLPRKNAPRSKVDLKIGYVDFETHVSTKRTDIRGGDSQQYKASDGTSEWQLVAAAGDTWGVPDSERARRTELEQVQRGYEVADKQDSIRRAYVLANI